MKIGMLGHGFVAAREHLTTALAEAGLSGEIVDVDPDEPTPADVLVPLGGTVDGPLLDAVRPRMVQQFGVGLQGVDLGAARERGIPVDNVGGAESGNATAVAELALMLLIASLRHLPRLRSSVERALVGEPIGTTLAGRTVALLGVGDIGAAVARLLVAFRAVPVGVGRRDLASYPGASAVIAPGDYHRVDDLHAALARCDDLVVCAPLTPATHGIVDAGALAALRPGGHVVNVSRGGVVDRDALLAALRSGRLAGAGLDVTWTEPIDPDDPLLAQDVVVTPHVGGVTDESYAAMARTFVTKVREALHARA